VAVREANLNLFAERERALELAAENDMLKAQEIEDRRRIQQLMDIAQPLAHDVTYFTDTNPGHSSCSSSGGGKFRLSVPRGDNGQQLQERALRSVYAPQPSSDTMQLRVESLELQVFPTDTSSPTSSDAPPPCLAPSGARASQNFEGKKCSVGIGAWLSQVSGCQQALPRRARALADRGCREELESATHRLNAHVTELTQRLCKTEVSLQANIHDYLSLRAETLQSTRHMQEQLVAANTTRDEAVMKLADMQVLPHPNASTASNASAQYAIAKLHFCHCLFLFSFWSGSARARRTSRPPCRT
jgi:hypothetical protein